MRRQKDATGLTRQLATTKCQRDAACRGLASDIAALDKVRNEEYEMHSAPELLPGLFSMLHSSIRSFVSRFWFDLGVGGLS